MSFKMSELVKKSMVVLFGMLLLGIGINFILIANIGTDAVTSACMGIYNIIGIISFGTAQIIFNIIIVGIAFFLNRKKIGIGTVIAAIASGTFVDLFQPLVSQALPADPNFYQSLLILVIGLTINGIAIAIYLSADFGVGAGEILAVIISEKNSWQFQYVKIESDIIMLIFSFFSGAVIGVGTIISALMIGPVVQFVMPYSKKLFHFTI